MELNNKIILYSALALAAIFIISAVIGGAVTGEATNPRRGGPKGGGSTTTTIVTCYDIDQDSFYSNCGSLRDCNDNNPNIYPGAPEICGNNLDDNCDGTSILCQGNIEIVARKSVYNSGEKVTLL